MRSGGGACGEGAGSRGAPRPRSSVGPGPASSGCRDTVLSQHSAVATGGAVQCQGGLSDAAVGGRERRAKGPSLCCRGSGTFSGSMGGGGESRLRAHSTSPLPPATGSGGLSQAGGFPSSGGHRHITIPLPLCRREIFLPSVGNPSAGQGHGKLCFDQALELTGSRGSSQQQLPQGHIWARKEPTQLRSAAARPARQPVRQLLRHKGGDAKGTGQRVWHDYGFQNDPHGALLRENPRATPSVSTRAKPTRREVAVPSSKGKNSPKCSPN